MQIRGGLDQDGAAIKVRHTAELLASSWVRVHPHPPLSGEAGSPLISTSGA
jgi:hypothetical protein